MNNWNEMQDDLDAVYRPAAPTKTVTVFTEPCRKCRGSGRWVGFSAMAFGQCFACKGTGKVTFKTPTETRQKARQAAAGRKAVAQQHRADKAAQKAAQWAVDHPAEAAWLESERGRFEFAASLAAGLQQYGGLTEKQLAAVQKMVAKAADRAQQQAQVAQSAPECGIDAIEVAFGNAKDAGVKWPRLRLDSFVFSPAGENSKNPGAVYVKEGETYLGKVAGGKFLRARDCTDDQQQRIVAAATDPKSAAIAYGKRFGSCSVCGRELSKEDSIEMGIGPICAKKFGW